jgi:hypothetical protein
LASVCSVQQPGLIAVAALFPEFIAREQPGLRGRGLQGRSVGLVRPAAAGEDRALRALTDRHCGYGRGISDEGEERLMTGLRPERRRTNAARRAPLRAASTQWLEVSKARSPKTAPGASRSGAACSVVLQGRQACAAGWGRQPTPGGKRSAQASADHRRERWKPDRGGTPSGGSMPRTPAGPGYAGRRKEISARKSG